MALLLSTFAGVVAPASANAADPSTGSWSPPVEVDLTNGEPNTIDCVSRAFCAVVDSEGAIVMKQDGHWGLPVHLDLQVRPYGISCVSSTFCVAVFEQGYVSTYDGATWTKPEQVVSTLFFEDVSCASETFCIAVDWESDYLTYDGTSWSDPIPIGTERYNHLGFLSCTTPTFCMASDSIGSPWGFDGTAWTSYADGQFDDYYNDISCASAAWCVLDHGRQVKLWDGSSWTYSGEFASSDLTGVSCVSATFCLAVATDGTAYRFDGATWQPTGKTHVPDVTAVSCWQEGRCALTTIAGEVLRFDGVWTDPRMIDPMTGGVARESCPTDDFCMAVDIHQNTMRYANGVWTRPRHQLLTGYPTGISCASSVLCVVVDESGGAIVYRAGRWSKRHQVEGMRSFSEISCVGPTFCVGTGWGYVVTFDGTTWSTPQQVLPNGAFTSLSCTSTTFCMGLKSGGGTEVYDGSGWRYAGEAFAYQASFVRCSSAAFCMAMDIYGRASYWDGTSWSAEHGTPGVVNVACPLDGFCVAMADGNRVYTYTDGVWQQTGWLGKVRLGRYYGIVCTATVTCMAINGNGYARRYTEQMPR